MKTLVGATAATLIAIGVFPLVESLAHDTPAVVGGATTSGSRLVADHPSTDTVAPSPSSGTTWTCAQVASGATQAHNSTGAAGGSGTTTCLATTAKDTPSPGSGAAAHNATWTSGALAAVGNEVNGLRFSVTPPLTLGQWASSFLAYIGVGESTSSDPRVGFLERWAQVEGTYDDGNEYNPLDTKYGVVGDGSFNKYGVKTYPTLTVGYQATLATMEQRFDHPILAALRDSRSSSSHLALALAESDWVGFGGRSWAEQFYAAEIARVPMRSFHLPLPTVSFQGRLVDPSGRALAEVCVSALSPTAPAKDVVTTASGAFSLVNLPRAAYRLQILDCRRVAGKAVPVFYNSKAAPSFTTTVASRATTLSTRCAGITACPNQHVSLTAPVVFGVLSPTITWKHPPSISFGTALSSTQLDARSSVPGTYTYTPARGAVLGPGSHAIRVVFRPRNRHEYSPRTSTTALQVSRAVPAVTWPPPVEIAEGTPLSSTQLDASSSTAGSFTYSPPVGAQLAVGAHVLAVRFQPKDRNAYRAVIKTVVIVVTSPTS